MIKTISLFVAFFATFVTFSQNYWQQEVNYTIEVKLNDQNHTISAFESFEYINHSPNTLDFLYIHLWANAYRNGETALGKQLYANNEKLLSYGEEEDRGGIDSLDFKVNGQSVKMEYDPEHIDICKIYLNTPLKSGERITVTTPYKIKIPSGEISRLGHIGQSYQITQWYPKPAVYDQNGWNQIPYLNQGEFYSEYGSFDVSITLPKNYVVGATGDLQTQSEIDFLNDLAAKTANKFKNGEFNRPKGTDKASYPESSSEFKTIRYTQQRVHDFAWFADKRYEVLKGEVELPHSKRKVTSWALFTPRNAWVWEKSIEYINDGTYYYSLWNGDYPYNQVTAVDGTISAGGGMEYPNVTVIGNTGSAMGLEVVIVHEVGHNWFYGILGSNERVHGWMDEGLNTLNEMRYVQTKYPNNTELSDMVLNGRFHLNGLNHHDQGDISTLLITLLGEDQPIETHSAKFTSINYGIIMYQKTGLIFHYLKDVLGENEFDKAMQAYFEAWKFKHPQPENLKAVLEQSTGKNLSWLFKDLIQETRHLDFKVKKVKSTENGTDIVLKNKGQVISPVKIRVEANGKSEELVSENIARKVTLHSQLKDVNLVVVDPNKQVPEIRRSNNTWDKSWMFNKKEPITYEFFFGDHERNKSNNFWTPILAANGHDRFMIGIASHNIGVPLKKYQYLLAPMFSFGRQSVSGIGELSYTFLPAKQIKLTRIGVSVKSFKNADLEKNRAYFVGLSPYLYLKLGNRSNIGPLSQSLLLQTMYRYDQFDRMKEEHVGGYLSYNLRYNKPNYAFEMNLRTDVLAEVNVNEQLGRSSAEINYKYKYAKNKVPSWMEFRAYIGYNWMYNNIPSYDLRYQLSMSGANGAQDLFLEEYFFNRTGNTQRMENMGGFKNTSYYGATSSWLAAGNFYMQMPFKPKMFGIYADWGTFDNGTKLEPIADAGIAVRLGKVLGVYFPVWMSKDLNDSYGTAKYGEKIRFSMKINVVNKPLSIPGIF